MSLPNVHTLDTIDLTSYTPSCGTAPVPAYIRAPFRSRLLKAAGILGGAITTANATITVTVNGTSVATFTVTQSGSAAGQPGRERRGDVVEFLCCGQDPRTGAGSHLGQST